ncbi:hypothetical protein ACP2YA_10840 [Staphylococcus epidermidis]|jgi:hypothetical protein|uniref:hypothetical protein n=1 Tax=Bacillati TaxID=1783272 RepID=UPI00026BF10E|nr:MULTISPECIES: hypothetical protein [Terrabacteria group]MDU2119633.1 hypothetical protein [Staphylococcus aureus]EJE20581.1 hypothetical protein HMPREF9975_12353 [Staphylococcus epidermidis NIHLM001]ENL42730.1 hypothetical protein B467_02508 [Staphylococcus epidermidis M0881]EVH50360.1 hypothetical protein T935_02526 [Staphylococcus aureus KINW6033]EVX93680.1 hypothetical protein U290_02154 [Staphylococcus aureus F80375]
MKKTKRNFYVNQLYNDKLKMIQRNNNISTLSSSIVFLIDYYIKNENKKDGNKKDEDHQKIIDDLSYIKKKLNGADFNILVALHMLADISEENAVTTASMKDLRNHINDHYQSAVNRSKHYLANKREF